MAEIYQKDVFPNTPPFTRKSLLFYKILFAFSCIKNNMNERERKKITSNVTAPVSGRICSKYHLEKKKL
jgi:hypothetical protein